MCLYTGMIDFNLHNEIRSWAIACSLGIKYEQFFDTTETGKFIDYF